MKHTARIILFVFLACLPSYASDLQQQQSTLYPYRSMIEYQEDFMLGGTTAGTVGSLGWIVSVGTTSYVNNETNYPGVLRRLTGVGFPVTAYTFLNTSNQVLVSPSLNTDMISIVRPSLATGDIQYRIGVGFLFNANPSDGFYFEKLFADGNIFCVTRNGGVQTRTDSTVAAPTTFTTFRVAKIGSAVYFYLNNSPVCVHTTNIPASQLMTIGMQVSNTNATDVGLDTDYVQYIITGLTR